MTKFTEEYIKLHIKLQSLKDEEVIKNLLQEGKVILAKRYFELQKAYLEACDELLALESFFQDNEPTASKKEIVAEEKQKGLTFEEWKKVKSFSVFGYRYIKEEETLYRVGFFNTTADVRGYQDVFVIQQFNDDEKPSLKYIGFKEDRKTATFDDIKGIEFDVK